jgi:predicted nucleic acid-binding protein
MIVDTSALLAYFDVDEPDHEAVSRVIDGSEELLVVSPYVVAELDYLVATRIGVDAELAVLQELSGGAWELASFVAPELAQAASVLKKCRDQKIGVADTSNVVLADRYQTLTIMTLDASTLRRVAADCRRAVRRRAVTPAQHPPFRGRPLLLTTSGSTHGQHKVRELVRAEGFEPSRSLEHRHLKPACLPFHHARSLEIVPVRTTTVSVGAADYGAAQARRRAGSCGLRRSSTRCNVSSQPATTIA